MDVEFSEDEICYYQIMDSFLEQYMKESEGTRHFLNILDDTECREAIAKSVSPSTAKFLESKTRAELETKLMILAIGASVAEAIVEAHRILQ
ncbi:hypothetical protein ACFLXE_03995 [Chloroflexota bacterium]